MGIKSIKKLRQGKIKVDLTGPQGNAFCLMGYARRLCKQLNRKHEPILEEMRSGDYEHLIQVFDREFGKYIDLYR